MEESLETWFYENKDIEPYEVCDKILTLVLGGKVLDNLTGRGVLGRHH